MLRAHLPQQGKQNAAQYCPGKNVWPPAPPSGLGIVRDVSHDRVGDGVINPGKPAQQTGQKRIHAEGGEQEKRENAERAGQQIIHQMAGAESGLLNRRNPVFGGGLIMRHNSFFID